MRRRADVPGRLGVVEQRRPAAPAVRVGVQEALLAQQPPARAQVRDEVGVGVLDPAAGVRADALVVGAVEPHRVDHREALLGAEPVVVLAEGDRRVDDARAVVGGHEVGGQDGVALLPVLLAGDEGEGRLVAGAEHVAAVEAVGHLGVLAQDALHERLGQHLAVARCGRRPAPGRPPRAALETSVHGVVVQPSSVSPARSAPARLHDREAHVDRRVLDVLVALGDLVGGQRRAAARAVRARPCGPRRAGPCPTSS